MGMVLALYSDYIVELGMSACHIQSGAPTLNGGAPTTLLSL